MSVCVWDYQGDGEGKKKTSNKLIPAETQPAGGGVFEGMGGSRWLGRGRGVCTVQARCLHEFLVERMGTDQRQAFWMAGITSAEKEDYLWAIPIVLCTDSGCDK